MTSNPWFTGITLVMLLMVCSENFPKALVSQNFNVVLVVVDEVDEEELELPEELNWFELSWGMTMTNSYSVSLSLLTFRQQKSTNVTHKASRKTRGKFGTKKHKKHLFRAKSKALLVVEDTDVELVEVDVFDVVVVDVLDVEDIVRDVVVSVTDVDELVLDVLVLEVVLLLLEVVVVDLVRLVVVWVTLDSVEVVRVPVVEVSEWVVEVVLLVFVVVVFSSVSLKVLVVIVSDVLDVLSVVEDVNVAVVEVVWLASEQTHESRLRLRQVLWVVSQILKIFEKLIAYYSMVFTTVFAKGFKALMSSHGFFCNQWIHSQSFCSSRRRIIWFLAPRYLSM